MPDAILHGGTAPVNLGSGYTLRAPGLRGTARILGPRIAGTRGPELATDAFDQAFAETSVEPVATIEFDVSSAPFPAAASPMRGPEGADAFELRVPDLGPEVGQVVLSIDEAGALHWHFPLDDDLVVQPSTTRGPGGSKVFRIPREIATPSLAQPADGRGLVSMVGRKLLKVLVYPVADAVLGPLTEFAVGKWEEHKRPHRVRRYLPGDRAPLTADDWTRLAAGRALLFVHGTFSTAEAGFAGLVTATLDALAARYANRVFAFDHPTLSVDPEANARWFFSQLPAGLGLDVDIVCHSRGGLVSRCLGGRASQFGVDPARFRVQRLVVAGVPNQGTLLADPDHMVTFLDRMTSALNLFPDNFVSDVLEGILTVVKVIGHAGLKSLDGLAAMKPGSALLTTLDQSPIPGCTVYGIGGDFEPGGAGLGAAFCTAADSLIDRVFGNAANDLVVPTDGMRAWGGGIQIPDDRFCAFSPDRGVIHTRYFGQAETSASLLQWLA
jgi:hypothetical protein